MRRSKPAYAHATLAKPRSRRRFIRAYPQRVVPLPRFHLSQPLRSAHHVRRGTPLAKRVFANELHTLGKRAIRRIGRRKEQQVLPIRGKQAAPVRAIAGIPGADRVRATLKRRRDAKQIACLLAAHAYGRP